MAKFSDLTQVSSNTPYAELCEHDFMIAPYPGFNNLLYLAVVMLSSNVFAFYSMSLNANQSVEDAFKWALRNQFVLKDDDIMFDVFPHMYGYEAMLMHYRDYKYQKSLNTSDTNGDTNGD